MVDFPSAVAVPSTASYAPPQVDFNWLANLANDYYKGQQNQFNQQQNQQTTALQQAFKGGLPTKDGQIDYQAIAQIMAQKGDVAALGQLAPLIQQQQNNAAARQPDPMFGGAAPQQAPQPAPQVQSQQPTGDIPPASAGLARSTTAPSPTSPQGPTVAAIVSSAVPNGQLAGTVSVNVARALKVEPSTPLNDEQQARAASLVRAYAQRQGIQPQQGSDPGLARLQTATFGQESTYGANTKTSSAGAAGPMQITQGTFDQFAAPGEKIGNTTDNMDVGNRILASYWKRYNGDAARAAVAYYSGPGNVAPPDSPTPWKRDISKDKKGKPILPVSQYVDQVMNKMGNSALRDATAQPPVAPGQRVAQGPGMVPPQVQPAAPGQVPVSPVAAGGPIAAQGQAPAPIVQGQQPAALPPQATPAQFVAPGNAQPQQPQPAPQSGPIGPQVQLPQGFKPGQEPQAIAALRKHVVELERSGNPNLIRTAPAFEKWAEDIAASIKPMPIHQGETLVDPRDRSVIYQGAPSNPNALALQRFLAENPGASAQQIDQFIQAGRSSGRSAIAMYMNKYQQEHPEATADDVKRAAQTYTTQTTAQNRFLSGPQGNTIRSLNVVVSHLQTMQDLGDALKNRNTRIFNSVAQRFAEETGRPAPTNFDTAKQIVGAEVIKALGVAGAGSQGERQEAAEAFSRASSPQQLVGAIAAARKLLVGQLEGLRQQFTVSTGLPRETFDQMLQPETRQFFGEGTGESKSPAKTNDGWGDLQVHP